MAKGDVLHTAGSESNGTTTVPGIVFGATPASGDLILIGAYVNGGDTTLTIPSGFTMLEEQGTDWPKLAVYAKVAGGSESNNYDLGLSQVTESYLIGLRVEGPFSNLSGLTHDIRSIQPEGATIRILAADQSVAANTLAIAWIATFGDRRTTMAFDNSFANQINSTDIGAGSLHCARRVYSSSSSTVHTNASWTGDTGGNAALVMIPFGSSAASITGTGALTAPAATASGAGVRHVTGTGALQNPLPTVSGSGTTNEDTDAVTGTGALTNPAATASGSGARGVSDLPGAIALTAPLPTISGTGTVSQVDNSHTGTGALSIAIPAASGSGKRGVRGSGALSITLPTVSGSQGPRAVSGTGALVSPLPQVNGVGVRHVTGTGALTAPRAFLNGVGPNVSGGDAGVAHGFGHPRTRTMARKYAHGRRGSWRS